MKIGVVGVPFNGDGTPPEIENPAAALRDAGVLRIGAGRTRKLVDYGDLEIPPFEGRRDPGTQILNLQAWRAVSLASANRLREIREQTDFAVVLGGDCSILVGICGAFRLAGERVGLVVADGHTDYRDAARSPSGEPADLEMAVITGRGPGDMTALFGAPPLVRPEDVVICGYREPDLIAHSAIRHHDRRTFGRVGAERMAGRALSSLNRVERVWLHFDVDVLDPSLMPVSFPEPDGLSVAEAAAFLCTAAGSGRCVGISVACYHPRLDPRREAAATIVGILSKALDPPLIR